MASLLKAFKKTDKLVKLTDYQHHPKLGQLPPEIQEFLFESKIYPDEAAEFFPLLVYILLKFSTYASFDITQHAPALRVLLSIHAPKSSDHANNNGPPLMMSSLSAWALETGEFDAIAAAAASASASVSPSSGPDAVSTTTTTTTASAATAPNQQDDISLTSSLSGSGNVPYRPAPPPPDQQAPPPPPEGPDDASAAPSAAPSDDAAEDDTTVRPARAFAAPPPMNPAPLPPPAAASDEDLQQPITSSLSKKKETPISLFLKGTRFRRQSTPLHIRRMTSGIPRAVSPNPAPRKLQHVPEVTINMIESDPHTSYSDWQFLSRGSYGNVHTAKRNTDNLPVAIKEIEIAKQNEKRIFNEIRIMLKYAHSCIVRLYEVYRFEDHFYLVMDYCDGGTVAKLLRSQRLEESHAAFIIRKVIRGIAYLHGSRVLHRDIKSENILMNVDTRVFIADMGLAVELGQRETISGSTGTPYWMAPEVIRGEPYDEKADIWSLGCLMYELLTGAPFYRHYDPIKAAFRMATRGAPAPPEKVSNALSADAKEFLHMCLRTDPADRATARELYRHPLLDKRCDYPVMARVMTTSFLGNAFKEAGIVDL